MEEKKSMTIQELLESMEKEMGRKPETMVLLAQINEGAVFQHAANKKFAMSGEQIPPKYKLLISLAVSAALGAEKCLQNFTKAALKKGATKEEIVESLLLAHFVKGTSVISGSAEVLRMISDSE